MAWLTPLPWTSGLRAGRINVRSLAAFSLWSLATTAQVTEASGRPVHMGQLHQCHGVAKAVSSCSQIALQRRSTRQTRGGVQARPSTMLPGIHSAEGSPVNGDTCANHALATLRATAHRGQRGTWSSHTRHSSSLGAMGCVHPLECSGKTAAPTW